MLRTILGPIDDEIIRYRVTFDPVLAVAGHDVGDS
ncbi:hypothetical protein BJY18_007028 [Amycolatopsis jiangsuensis]|uniref:Uncharacterized protein n=1 Tax=Amycolatopsis jiangsuensis TaxID=1181879 RepID=A0A840J6X5_9PSEU|nr:hypothetical protein [Amycolatopsis jiangsuensis]